MFFVISNTKNTFSLPDVHYYLFFHFLPYGSTLPINILSTPPFWYPWFSCSKVNWSASLVTSRFWNLFTKISQIKNFPSPKSGATAIVIAEIATHDWKIFSLLTFFYAIDIELCLSVHNFLSGKHILYCLVWIMFQECLHSNYVINSFI